MCNFRIIQKVFRVNEEFGKLSKKPLVIASVGLGAHNSLGKTGHFSRWNF